MLGDLRSDLVSRGRYMRSNDDAYFVQVREVLQRLSDHVGLESAPTRMGDGE